MNMMREKIDSIVPYLPENFITFPLAEEGKYIPFVNFWQVSKLRETTEILDACLTAVLDGTCYEFFSEEEYNVVTYSIYPKFDETEDGGYEFADDKWSVESMLDLVITFLDMVRGIEFPSDYDEYDSTTMDYILNEIKKLSV